MRAEGQRAREKGYKGKIFRCPLRDLSVLCPFLGFLEPPALPGEGACRELKRRSNGGGRMGVPAASRVSADGRGKRCRGLEPLLSPNDRSSCAASLPKRGGGGADLRGRWGLWRQESSGVFNRGRFWRRGEGGLSGGPGGKRYPPRRWRGGPADDKGTFGEGRVHLGCRTPVGRGARRALAGRGCQRLPWVRR